MDELAETETIPQLLQEGYTAIENGDTIVARNAFRRVTELDPANSEAWIALSDASPVLTERRGYLQQALTASPDLPAAKERLAEVEKLLADGVQIIPRARRVVVPVAAPTVDSTPVAVFHCYRHPDRETGLRCVQCNRPICAQCATPAAVGQLCPECRKGRTPRNYQVSTSNMVVSGVVALIAMLLAALLFSLFGSGFLVFIIIIFAAPALAELVIRISDRLTTAKRGRRMQVAVGIGLALGGLPWLLLTLNLFLLAFVVLSITTAVARLR